MVHSLRQHIAEHDIHFEGPVPPRKWPERYRHLFQVIRDIGINRYEDYMQQNDGNDKFINDRMTRVKALVDKAARFRRNPSSLESTWRNAIEQPAFEKLAEVVVCQCCGDEVWDSEYKAYPFDKREKAELEKKIQKRVRCARNNPNQSIIWIDDESDDEQGEPIFQTALEHEVSHEPEDNLDKSKIPMKPDRVIGLSRTAKFRGYIETSLMMNLVHDPLEGDDMIYPFLVLEAKREKKAPGFRQIEAQTAFPIRRFLRIQEDLRKINQGNLDPLVWFFAYQGDEWRLSAAIIDNGKTRIFHLWLGIIESEDGALQLLQIVDFIWAWARDVYRPQIRSCLACLPNPYKRSPSSDDRTVIANLRSPEPRSQSLSQPSLDSVQEEQPAITVQNYLVQEPEEYDRLRFENASSNSFLRWATHRDISKDWALKSSIRHSDIVMFSFRVFEIPDTKESFEMLTSSLQDDLIAQAAMFQLRKFSHENKNLFVLKRGDISNVEKSWTGTDVQSSYGPWMNNLDESVRCFFFFQSYCQKSDWQIHREVYCIVCSSAAAEFLGNYFSMSIDARFEDNGIQCMPASEVIKSTQQLRGLSGRYSVACALLGSSLILQNFQTIARNSGQKCWCSPQDAGLEPLMIPELLALFNTTSSGNLTKSRQYQSSSLLQVSQGQQLVDIPLSIQQVGDHFGQLDAVMAIKPTFWSPECPRFCLYIFLGQDYDDDERLKGLLRDTIRANTFFAVYGNDVQDQPSWSADDTATLRNWEENFSEENMLKYEDISSMEELYTLHDM